MSSKDIFGKFMKFIGMDEEEAEEEVVEEVKERPKEVAPVQPQNRRITGKVININPDGSNMQSKVKVVEPKQFEDCLKIGEYMKSRHQVLINMQETDPEEARRILDFISGCSFALDGTLRKVGSGVFCHVPYTMEINMEMDKKTMGNRSFFDNAVGYQSR